MKYNVEFCYEDDFPIVVRETDSLEEALESADCFEAPEGWSDEGDASICMSVMDTSINTCVYWTNTDGDCGSDAKDDYPGTELINARLHIA